MQSWCVYVGTTIVLTIIDANVLAVANAGDSRCVLLRDRRAFRLTVDHKPDVLEEAQ
jgi:serine/threonine protein phosphatase PrpC